MIYFDTTTYDEIEKDEKVTLIVFFLFGLGKPLPEVLVEPEKPFQMECGSSVLNINHSETLNFYHISPSSNMISLKI